LVGAEVFADAPDWTAERVLTNNFWQWENVDGLFMLNVDIALVRDMDNRITGNGEPECEMNSGSPIAARCPLAVTLNQAGEYRNNNAAWLDDFKAALTTMLRKGLDN
jgi:hypothetical protein